MDSKYFNWALIWFDWLIHGMLYSSFIGIFLLLSPKLSDYDEMVVGAIILFATVYATYMSIRYGKHEYL